MIKVSKEIVEIPTEKKIGMILEGITRVKKNCIEFNSGRDDFSENEIDEIFDETIDRCDKTWELVYSLVPRLEEIGELD
jgi:hypothetical protein